MDLLIINFFAWLVLGLQEYFPLFSLYISISWLVSCYKTGFYEVYRYTRPASIVTLLSQQLLIFSLLVLAFYGLFKELSIARSQIGSLIVSVFLTVAFIKFGVFYLLKTYRSVLGGNVRNVVILGHNNTTQALLTFFKEHKEFGYNVKEIFDVSQNNRSLEAVFSDILKLHIDEVYCSIAQFSNEQLEQIVEFTDNNLKHLKFIPDNRELFTKKLSYDHLGITPILSLRTIPIDTPVNQFIKRSFDVVMALCVIIGVLSWLIPILAILIKLDSKGPVFFKQKRNGLDYREFDCYKFRSMLPNEDADIEQVSKNDQRITRVGRFLRKTSIDELPQFFNVLKGNMSTVGPRPHMVSHTHMYAARIDKFMVRHFIKPGITGLAQVSGFRGEIENDSDIVNRVKFDIFYVENWSLFLDIKIIGITLYKAITGDEKAY